MLAVTAMDYRVVPSPSGHEAVGVLLLERGADPNHADSLGRTPLHLAVETRKFELINALLARGANPNAQIAKALPFRRGDYVSRAGHRGATPFWLAAMAADLDAMRLLAEGGADPRLPSANRTTPLMVAAGLGQTDSRMPPIGRMLEAVTFLFTLDDDVNGVNAAGQGPIHGAASVSADSIIELLAARGGKVDLKDKQGRTPWDLTQSVLRPRPDTAALLRRLEKQPPR
jgi:ankyrin repeat protein